MGPEGGAVVGKTRSNLIGVCWVVAVLNNFVFLLQKSLLIDVLEGLDLVAGGEFCSFHYSVECLTVTEKTTVMDTDASSEFALCG